MRSGAGGRCVMVMDNLGSGVKKIRHEHVSKIGGGQGSEGIVSDESTDSDRDDHDHNQIHNNNNNNNSNNNNNNNNNDYFNTTKALNIKNLYLIT